jgi:hypothetical protein
MIDLKKWQKWLTKSAKRPIKIGRWKMRTPNRQGLSLCILGDKGCQNLMGPDIFTLLELIGHRGSYKGLDPNKGLDVWNVAMETN